MFRLILGATLLASAGAALATDAPHPAEAKPQWQRMLAGDDAKKAAEIKERIDAAEQADDYAEAVRLHEELLALRIAVQGAEHWEVVTQRWAADGERKVAALDVQKRADWRKALQRFTDATVMQAKGEYAKAEPLFRESRRWYEDILGEKHLGTAVVVAWLGVNLNYQQKYAEAEPLHEKSLGIYMELLGERHPYTAGGYGNLGFALSSQDKFADAHAPLGKAFRLTIELHGLNHPDTTAMFNNLAGNYHMRINAAEQADQYVEAISLHEELLALRTTVQGAEHWEVVSEKWALDAERKVAALSAEHRAGWRKASQGAVEAQQLQAKREYAQAQPLFLECRKWSEAILGEKHPRTANSYYNLATNLHYIGKYAEAQPLFEKSLELYRDLLGDEDPFVASNYNWLIQSAKQADDYDEALRLLDELVALRTAVVTVHDVGRSEGAAFRWKWASTAAVR